jgi:hypothetical protein
METKPSKKTKTTSTLTTSKKSKASGENVKKNVKVKSFMRKSGRYYTPFKRAGTKTSTKDQFSGRKN